MLKNAIALAVNTMLEEYEFSGGVAHDGQKGAFREFFVSSLLRPILPEHFGITSGTVVDATGKQSNQTDVIIFDKRKMPTIFTRGENSIVPIDSVLRVIEVKSKLDSNGVKQIIKASKKLKWDTPGGLMIYNHIEGDPSSTHYPFMSVFAYSSAATKMDEFKRFRKVDSRFDEMVKSICILNKGVWSSSSDTLLSDDPVENTISYLIRLLDKIESDANTRSNFHLSSWLNMQT